MAYSFLIFDFGSKEEAAQQARHRIDGWKQGFRLDKKLQVKFDRKEPATTAMVASEPPAQTEAAASKGKVKRGAKADAKPKSGSKPPAERDEPAEPAQIHLIVRLDFSDHEKLSRQRWVERIPSEEPFKAARPKVVRAGDSEFNGTSELFDSLD